VKTVSSSHNTKVISEHHRTEFSTLLRTREVPASILGQEAGETDGDLMAFWSPNKMLG